MSVLATVPRGLHPGAWWLWAIGLAGAAASTTNPLLLVLVVAVAARVVVARRADTPWSRAFGLFLRLGLVVIAIRTVAQVLLGVPAPGNVVAHLPQLALPDWAAGVSVGGPVTDAAIAAAMVEGLRLAAVLACLGAANALANTKRLLAALPAALYEVGVATVVALAFAPSLIGAVARVRAARRLRGRHDRGVRAVVSVAMPVLDDALERSLALAAAMDSRGYGRRATVSARSRRLTAGLTLGGLAGVCVGLYGLLGEAGARGLWLIAIGVATAAAGISLAGHRGVRTRYRPDPWVGPEWITAFAGVAALAGAVLTGITDMAALAPAPLPLGDLPLPAFATGGLLLALLPAWLTPRPPEPARTIPPAVATTRIVPALRPRPRDAT